MKKLISTFIIIISLFVGNFTSNAQEKVIIAKNDTLVIELDGQTNGSVTWQKSENGINWNDIATTNVSTLEYPIFAPAYFRSEMNSVGFEPYYSATLAVSVDEKFVVKAGHGYAEPYSSSPGLSMQENGVLSGWTNFSRKAAWYLYQKAGTYDMSLYLSSYSASNYDFNISISPCYSGLNFENQSQDLTYSSSGSNVKDVLPVKTITIPVTGYYKYELTALNPVSDITIHELWFNSVVAPGESGTVDTHATDYLSSPSVHLSFSTTESTTREYDWMYQEILVPEGYDPLSTYWESIGFFRGYMGIQTNSDTERRVLFSAWDAVDLDKYPDAPKELLVSLVDKAEYTKANSFGNEGTGGQSYVGVGNPDTWKTGTPVKFLMNARRDGSLTYNGDLIKHTVVSAWYDAGEGWKYIASWRVPVMPGGKDMFDGFYSFLENYGWRNGQLARKGYYYNAFGKETGSDRWVHFNKVGFSNTDGSEGQRIDFEQGVSDEYPSYFYMVSGGYGEKKKTANQVPLQTNYPTMDLASFTARVDEALLNEERMNNLVYKDKTNWEVISFSSQEASGESNGNGLASLIIDGNTSTYWHSKWTGSGSSYPHSFVVDMKEQQEVDGFKFTLSGSSNRHMKNIKIEKSDDGETWTELLHQDAPDETAYMINLPGKDSFRYFKLTIYNGHTDEVHTRINEIDLFSFPEEEEPAPILPGIADKTSWKLLEFSSEAYTGESNGNGFASLLIDGDSNTYWHSQWQYGGASFPHFFVIDMNQELPIEAFKFTLSGGSNRHMKNIVIEKSNDKQNWTPILTTDAPDELEYTLNLDQVETFRYFRLTINNGHTEEVHTRINEIDVIVAPQPINKSNWSVKEFSSQAYTGEPNGNGFASLVIDGDDNSYWHSQWQYGGSSYPHYLVIDMSQQHTINSFEFVVSGTSKRYMKNIKIEKSNNGQRWTELLHTDAPNVSRYTLDLPSPKTFRYFKLTIYNGQDDTGSDDVHTRINEIYVH
ncbi:MAG: discoidin domain-containing protein [Bacteroidales bacterium]|nr:discoidin domain-containing protein [Bacteroidales bacterium]